MIFASEEHRHDRLLKRDAASLELFKETVHDTRSSCRDDDSLELFKDTVHDKAKLL